ncbi:MAG: DUF1634 domain-containing protein [Candidatus Acidiferrum sp.]
MSSGLTQTDKRMDELMGLLLRSGVILAAAIVFAGGVVYIAWNPYPATNYQVFQGEPQSLRTISGILSEARAFKGRGLIQLGLLVLIFTPIARVAFSVLAFCYQCDWKYVLFTLVVLGLLLYSLLGQR